MECDLLGVFLLTTYDLRIFLQVAVRLEPIIAARKAQDEWDVDAFAGSKTDKLDTREIEEAIGETLFYFIMLKYLGLILRC